MSKVIASDYLFIIIINGLAFSLPTYIFNLGNITKSYIINQPSKISWRIVDYIGGTHAQYQQLLVMLTGAIYIAILASIVEIADPEPILLGSLIGAFPIVLFEANRYFQYPYLKITDYYVIIYPDRFHILDPIDKVEAENAVCIHAVVSNEGRQTAEEATVRIRDGELGATQYHTRWRDENRVYRDIAPGEQQGLHLLWVDLEDEDLELPTSDTLSDQTESQYPPGNYPRIRRWELSNRPIDFEIILRSKNTPERVVSISGVGDDVTIEGLIENATEWDAVKSIKKNYDHFAVVYERKEYSELHVPKTIDFNDFEKIESFKIPNRLDPQEALERTHRIVWIDAEGTKRQA